MKHRLKSLLFAAALFCAPMPAHALTAGEVANDMDSGQFAAWLAGADDMAIYLFIRIGDPERSQCIKDWGGDDRRSYIREFVDSFRANPTLPAAAVYEALMLRRCGPYQ